MSNMVIRTNILSLNSHRNLGMTGNAQARASRNLSSGFRINTAADDAAGLGISEKMRGQIRGLDQASRNAADGISLIQTAEGAMQTVNDIVIRIRELVVQAANDTNVHDYNNVDQSDRARIQDEINQLLDEIDQIAYRTEFNTRTLLNGDWSADPLAGISQAVVGAWITDNIALFNALDDAIEDLDTAQANFDEGQRVLDLLQAEHDRVFAMTGQLAMEAQASTIAAALLEVGLSGGALEAALGAALDEVWGTTDIVDDMTVAADGSVTFNSAADWETARDEYRDTLVGDWVDDILPTVTRNATVDGYISGIADWDDLVDAIDPTEAGSLAESLTDATVGGLLETLQDAREDLVNARNALEGAFVNSDFAGSFRSAEELRDAFHLAQAGQSGRSLWFHIGANENQGVRLNIESVSVESLGLSELRTRTAGNIGLGGSVEEQANTGFVGVLRESGEQLGSSDDAWLSTLDTSLAQVTSQRSILGAMQNRLEFSIENLDIASENLQAANSRIRDADMAREMMRLTQMNVLQQAATAMLAQANQAPQMVLQLLG